LGVTDWYTRSHRECRTTWFHEIAAADLPNAHLHGCAHGDRAMQNRSRARLYLGFGANYRSETDYLESTRWNFAYLVAVRFDLDSHGRLLELGIRHWSDFWIKQPNRGQDFVTLSFGF
jgi:hypothetical protein